MSKFVIDIVFSLTMDELSSLTKLAEKEGKPVEEVARECMNAACKDRLLNKIFDKIKATQKELDEKPKQEYNEDNKQSTEKKPGIDCC